MTRFARARGSKASNERAPEDSTPWEVMKEQLLQAKKNMNEAKNRQEAEQQRIENYETFLKEHKVQKRKAEWCDFPETNENVSFKRTSTDPHIKKKKKQKQSKSLDSTCNDDDESTRTEKLDCKASTNSKKNKKRLISNDQKNMSDNSVKNIPQSERENQNITESSVKNDQLLNTVSTKKLKKNKKGKKKNVINNDQEENITRQTEISPCKEENKALKQKAKKNKISKESQPLRRKPIQDRSFQLIINGKDIELVRYDGFPIMKRDAERLEELKTNMIKKGIPKSEVQRTMKLERRRAEKALARLKRDVCYNCRKGGHNLSDCPDLKNKVPGVGGAEGMCFKCGSTEHRQFECKVQRDKEFRFATCFICKESGHIARQCPDNPKGLYPNGGCCKLCGDVTHLRKDCPTVHNEKEEKSIKLQTLESEDNVEGIEQKPNNVPPVNQPKKPKKIKF